MECQFCKSPLKDIGGVMYCAKECTEYAAWFDYTPEEPDTWEDLQDSDVPREPEYEYDIAYYQTMEDNLKKMEADFGVFIPF